MDLNPETYRPYKMYEPRRRTNISFGWMGHRWFVILAIFLVFFTMEQLIAHSLSTDSAERAAETLGFSNVKIIARHTVFPNLQGCGSGDMVKFDITAVDEKGVQRSFFVCDGILKGATVRFD